MRRRRSNDEERLAMKRGSMPPPLPRRVENPRIRRTPSVTRIQLKIRTRCIALLLTISNYKSGFDHDDQYSQEWFDFCRSSFPKSVGKQVQTLIISTCRRTSVASSSTICVLSTGRVNSGNQRIGKASEQRGKLHCCRCVTSQRMLGKQLSTC